MKKIFICTLTFLCLFSFCGCTDKGIAFTIGYSEATYFGEKKKDTGEFLIGAQAIVRSCAELKSLCKEWNNNAFSEDKEQDTEFYRKLRSYEDDFFRDNALVIYTSLSWNKSLDPKVKKLTIENEELVLTMVFKNGTFNNIAEAITFLIEVKKDDIKMVKTIR